MSDVIYLITCDKCKLQYVGETFHKLNNRFNWHNSCFRYPKKYSFYKIPNEHFEKGYSKDSLYSVTIIEKLERAGRTDRSGMDKLCQLLRKARERYWMIELRTMYPYGFNDRYGGGHKTENTHIHEAKMFDHHLGNITESILEIFVRVSVNFHHRNLIEKLMQCCTTNFITN